MMRFHCPVLNVLLFHPLIENVRTEQVCYGSTASSMYLFLWRLHWEVALQKVRQELYKNFFLLEEGDCKCFFD